MEQVEFLVEGMSHQETKEDKCPSSYLALLCAHNTRDNTEDYNDGEGLEDSGLLNEF